jgi:hypothetical protein
MNDARALGEFDPGVSVSGDADFAPEPARLAHPGCRQGPEAPAPTLGGR